MDDKITPYFDLDERRSQARVYRSGEVFIELDASRSSLHETLRCEVVDISPNGAQILVARELPEKSIHTLIVDLDRYHNNYRLSAEVLWTKAYRGDFLVGIGFLESEQTQIIDWRSLLAKCLN